jgi:hypothetical protein
MLCQLSYRGTQGGILADALRTFGRLEDIHRDGSPGALAIAVVSRPEADRCRPVALDLAGCRLAHPSTRSTPATVTVTAVAASRFSAQAGGLLRPQSDAISTTRSSSARCRSGTVAVRHSVGLIAEREPRSERRHRPRAFPERAVEPVKQLGADPCEAARPPERANEPRVRVHVRSTPWSSSAASSASTHAA